MFLYLHGRGARSAASLLEKLAERRNITSDVEMLQQCRRRSLQNCWNPLSSACRSVVLGDITPPVVAIAGKPPVVRAGLNC